MSFRASIAAALFTLILSACGTASTVQTFVTAHTICLPAGYSLPAWSPDGTHIYYTVTDLMGGFDIHVMNSMGGNDRLLVADARFPLPSPDGRLLMFWRPNKANVARPERGLLDLATLEQRNLGDLGSEVSWSPDSQWIVYATSDPMPPIMKIAVATGQKVALTRLEEEKQFIGDARPLWSPGPAGDGTRIAFASDRDGPLSVYLMDPDGANVTRLDGQDDPGCTANDGRTINTPLAWSPDGTRLAVARACGPDTTLAVVSAEGGAVTGWDYPSAGIVAAEWSPDGKHILTLVYAGKYMLDVADADGSGLKTIRTDLSDPRWSPDPVGTGSGTRIVFVGIDKAGLEEIYTIAPDGSGLTQLTVNPGLGQVCLH